LLRALALIPLLFANLILWGTPVFLGGFVKLLTFGAARRRVILGLAWLAERWVVCNDFLFDALLTTRWDVDGFETLRRDGRYLVISNHLSWTDIFALFRVLRGHAPFIRFFLKRELIWFPILGQACWSLEFPFMRRYSPEYLAQHPEKRGRDLETTRIACRRYRDIPVTIANFVEGTRFTRDKHEDQQSPYRYLLRPRAGGVGFVLASMAEQLDAVYDVSIVYPGLEATIWSFVTNRIPRVLVRARRLDVPRELYDDAITQPGPRRERFKEWIEAIWREKDAQIASLVEASGDATSA
jgi:1-acyl-sn-glycerol-3-phosphate acyltransferase